METVFWTLVAILTSIFLYLLYSAIRINKHFDRKGLPYEKPYPIIGNLLEVLLRKESIGERQKAVCDKFPNEQMVGFFDFSRPSILIKDPTLAEKVLIKDFQHFVDRGLEIDENRDPTNINLFNMAGKRWKVMRNKLSPVFTTGKLKYMFSQMEDIGTKLNDTIDSGSFEKVELKGILCRFVMDLIASCGFGIEPTNLADAKSEFMKMGEKVFSLDWRQLFKLIIVISFPKLGRKFNVTIGDPKIKEYFCDIIYKTIEHRRKTKARRNDFVDLMLHLEERGTIEIQTKDPSDDYLNVDSTTYTTDLYEITDDVLVGQAFAFLTAGFETTSAVMTFVCFEFTQNPFIQKRARKEVLEKVKANNGILSFAVVKEMTYLEMCIKETMRKYPPGSNLFRSCTKEYTFPNGVRVHPGDRVVIQLYAICSDPQYYPNPRKFDPERFAPDITYPPCVFMPFGEGPRICIASKFALLQMKIGLAKLLMCYDIALNKQTRLPITYSKKTFATSPEYPIYFNLKKLSE